MTVGRFRSIRRLTDIAITRVHPRKLVSPVSLGRIAAASPPQHAQRLDMRFLGSAGGTVSSSRPPLTGVARSLGQGWPPLRRAGSSHRRRRRAASLTVTSTAADWQAAIPVLMPRRTAGPIRLLPRHHRPGDARHFVASARQRASSACCQQLRPTHHWGILSVQHRVAPFTSRRRRYPLPRLLIGRV